MAGQRVANHDLIRFHFLFYLILLLVKFWKKKRGVTWLMPQTQIRVRSQYGGEEMVTIDATPDQCPLCHLLVTPMEQGVSTSIDSGGWPCVERLLQCPNQKCHRLFIARYFRSQPGTIVHYLRSCVPVELKAVRQSATIVKVSPDFCSIYEQAHNAEQYELLLVAGPGYRKALEFLIKDYIISQLKETDAKKLADEKAVVEKTLLGGCIKTYIKSEQIKEVSKRATWLGNDETHYVRKWEDKDLNDLKKLISLTLHWIEVETLTLEVIADMPEGKG
jgi:hypothetical protein